MNISFWCEFPNKINWKKTGDFLKSIYKQTEIFIAVKSKKEFLNWKKKIKSKNIKLIPWVLLPKKHGYWFSGFSSREDIRHLEQFIGDKVFIDAEPPLSEINKPFFKYAFYYIGLMFHSAVNLGFLEKEVESLCKKNKVLYSEFPFPHLIFKRLGIYINSKHKKFNNNLEKVLGWYTTFFGETFRFLIRPYLRHKARQVINYYGNNKVSFAVGLVGSGISPSFECTYLSCEELRDDLQDLQNLGAKKVIIYSIESLMKKEDLGSWKEVIKKYS